jgi:glutamate--cysteine ligase
VSPKSNSVDSEPLVSPQDLGDYLASGETPRDEWRVGTEYEKLVLSKNGGQRLPYRSEDGGPDVFSLLETLAATHHWSPEYDDGVLLALKGDDGSITLEPGGQFELSGAPRKTIFDMATELERHEADLKSLEASHAVRWLWVGSDPTSHLDDIPWMPKARYDIMRRYLPPRGDLAHHMMKATCTVQANLDFSDEIDMGKKLRAGMGLSSIVTAMFANSPFRQGKPSGYKSFRMHVWERTDPERCGLLRQVFEEQPCYEQYVRFAMDVPMFMLVRDGTTIDCAGITFSSFLKKGIGEHHATLADWILHLSTLFPDVRLKTYLEVRSADSVHPDLLPALPSLWKGIFYDTSAIDAAWDLVKRWSFDDRLAHRHDTSRDALRARVPGARYPTTELAKELLKIARHGLTSCATTMGHQDEGLYLDGLEALVTHGRCPADTSLEWYTRSAPKPAAIMGHFEARPEDSNSLS